MGREEPGRATEEGQGLFKPGFSGPALSMAWRAGWRERRDPEAMAGSEGRVLHPGPGERGPGRACAGRVQPRGLSSLPEMPGSSFPASEYLSPAVQHAQGRDVCVRQPQHAFSKKKKIIGV